MSKTETLASALATSEDLYGDLALLNCNGLSFRETLEVHALVLSNRILRTPSPDPVNYSPREAAELIRPDVKGAA
jgi:hypothetical protein